MFGKNNKLEHQRQRSQRQQLFSIRKYSIGVSSVAIATALLLNAHVALVGAEEASGITASEDIRALVLDPVEDTQAIPETPAPQSEVTPANPTSSQTSEASLTKGAAETTPEADVATAADSNSTAADTNERESTQTAAKAALETTKKEAEAALETLTFLSENQQQAYLDKIKAAPDLTMVQTILEEAKQDNVAMEAAQGKQAADSKVGADNEENKATETIAPTDNKDAKNKAEAEKDSDNPLIGPEGKRDELNYRVANLTAADEGDAKAEKPKVTIDNEVHYQINGVNLNGDLRYGTTDFSKVLDNGDIELRVGVWTKLGQGWNPAANKKNPYFSSYILNFQNPEFYKEIKSIEVNKIFFTKEAEGALWRTPALGLARTGAIGLAQVHKVTIHMNDGKTLDNLGLADTKLTFDSLFTNDQGLADSRGFDNGFILKNNPIIPPLPAKRGDGNEYYLGSGADFLTGFNNTKDGDFTVGAVSSVVRYNPKDNAIYSTFNFKPNQNYLQSNSGWLVYINQKVPEILMNFINPDNVYIGVSNYDGKFTPGISPVQMVIPKDSNGLISTKDTPELSGVGKDWAGFAKTRSKIDGKLFYGALGQSRSVTIKYNLKDSVDVSDFTKKLNDYIEKNNQLVNFESWYSADFVDQSSVFPNIRKPDGGAPNKWLKESYANSFLQVIDSDKDGIYDFVEEAAGYNPYSPDTDGDGVPDNVEFGLDSNNDGIEDIFGKPVQQTEVNNPKDYIVPVPVVPTVIVSPALESMIEVKVPRIIYDSPANAMTSLKVTNPEAGNVIVRAYRYVEGQKAEDYTLSEALTTSLIPFENLDGGNVSLKFAKGSLTNVEKIQVIAYAPDGKYPAAAKTLVTVTDGIIFDPNGGQWSDGTTESKLVPRINGTVTPPESPTRNDYSFLGWSADSKAKTPDPDTYTNNDPKTLYAVWGNTPLKIGVNLVEVVENVPVQDLTVVTVNRDNAVITSQRSHGMGVDGQGNLFGTPTAEWTGAQESQQVIVPVTVTASGLKNTENVPVTILRDTDSDGIPDTKDDDDDNDNVSDKDEIAAGTDPKDPGSKPNSQTPDTTKPVISPISDQRVTDKQPIKDIPVVVDEKEADVAVTGLPNGLAYNKEKGTIAGTPAINDWGKTEETKEMTVTVSATDKAGNKGEIAFLLTVDRDTDTDGIPDNKDDDDDNDGVSDKDEINAGTDPKDPDSKPDTTKPVILPIDNQTVIEKHPIKDITVTVDDENAEVAVDGLPNGLGYDENKGVISGTPVVEDWTKAEETRDFTVTVTATDNAGNKGEETFVITIERDTDGDGIPDNKDDDDDNDGVSDKDEINAGTDPKDPNSKPDTTKPDTTKPVISPIDNQTVIEKHPIKDITVTVDDENAEVAVDGLPNGLGYDENKGVISGTPVVEDWAKAEETRDFTVTVTATDNAGNKGEETFVITIERDTDGDGIPDNKDDDDDNDGVSDKDEIDAGTDPKDPDSKPEKGTNADTIDPDFNGEGKPGETVNVPNTGDAIPDGATVTTGPGAAYDPSTGGITVTVPEDAKPGDVIKVPVKVTYPDDSVDEIEVTVTVTAPTLADKTSPVFNGTGNPGETVTVPNSGDPLPDGSTVTITVPGVSYDPSTGNITVIVPETAQPGDIVEIPVTITYPDGSVDSIVVSIKVTNVMTADDINQSNKTNNKEIKGAKTLPDTGEADNLAIFSAATIAILVGVGLVTTNRGSKEEN